MSRDRQRFRRLLSCLPASKPDFRFVLSVPLSVESPFLSRPMADSTLRLSVLSRPIHHCLSFSFSTLASQSRLPSLSRPNPRRAGSLSKAHCRFSKFNSFVRSFCITSTLRERRFPHTTLFTTPSFLLSFARFDTRARLSQRSQPKAPPLRVTSSF